MTNETLKGKGYFLANDEIFKKEISANARLVYIYLCKCADCFGKSWPSHNNIASGCSLSVSSVKLAIKELHEANIVTVSHRYREEGGKSSNLYMVMDRLYNKSFWCNPEIFKKNISAKAKLIYLYFCRCCNKEGTCYPAHRTTAAACMVSISAVRNAIKELVEVKLLEVFNRQRENNGQTSNLYTLLAPIIDAAVAAIKKTSNIIKGRSMTKKEAEKAPKDKTTRFPKLIAFIQSYINRGHSHILNPPLLNSDYERTIPILRINHI